MPCLDASNHGRHPADNESYKQNLKTTQRFEVDAGPIESRSIFLTIKKNVLIRWNNSPMAAVECPSLEFLH